MYHRNKHTPPLWPGDDVCKGEPKGKAIGSVLEHLKPVDESEGLEVTMQV